MPNQSNTHSITNKSLMNNSYNYNFSTINNNNLYMNRNISQNNTLNANPIKSVNISKYDSTTYNNRKSSFDNKYNYNNISQNTNLLRNQKSFSSNKRSILSSGILKPSRRNKKYDKVIKNGIKIKNIDINRDYDENPSDDDTSSNISAINKNMKNKLVEKAKENNLNNEKGPIVPNLNNNEQSNLKPKQTIKQNTNINNKNDEVKRDLTHNNFSISKQKELTFSKTIPKTPENKLNSLNKNKIENSQNSIIPFEEVNPQFSTPDTIQPFLNYTGNNELLPQQTLTQELINVYQGTGFRVCSLYTKAGKDTYGMEKIDQDTPLISLNVGGIEGLNIFGVLDGHGACGHLVSQFCHNYFLDNMKSYIENNYGYLNNIITADDIYYTMKSDGFYYITELFNNADSELMLKAHFDHTFSGTTCNLVFQFNNHLVDFNVGDSRSIIIEDNGTYTNQVIKLLSVDHKPNLPDELLRIELSGGVVEKFKTMYGNEMGPPRVYKAGSPYPGLAMSRSLGDLQAKECGVISSPQIIEYDLNSFSKYFVVCSDGIWEFMNNETVRDIGNNFYNNSDVAGFCKELVNTSINVWSQREKIRDDITVVAVFL